jgi:hypothetical protein
LLKIQIERRREKGVEVLWLGQPNYVEHILNEYKHWLPTDGRVVKTPMIVGWKHDEDSPRLNKTEETEYRAIIACCVYLSGQTRLDISFTTNHLAQFTREPRECDRIAVQRLLKYLSIYNDLGPTYFRSADLQESMKSFMTEEGNTLTQEQAPQGYADASWGTEQGYKSRTGIIFRFAGGPITWYSGKQAPVAMSSAEAELYALSDSFKDVAFGRDLFNELNIKLPDPTLMMEDNNAAIQISEDPKFHSRVKHLGIRLGFIRQMVQNKLVQVKWISTERMLADIMTKALNAEMHWLLLYLIGMRRLCELEATDVDP